MSFCQLLSFIFESIPEKECERISDFIKICKPQKKSYFTGDVKSGMIALFSIFLTFWFFLGQNKSANKINFELAL